MLSNERRNTGKGSSSKAPWLARIKVLCGTTRLAGHANPTMLRRNELTRDFRREDHEYSDLQRVETRLTIRFASACRDYPFARTYRSTNMKKNLENASSLEEIFYFEKK